MSNIMRAVAGTQTRTEFMPFKGGLNLTNPAMQVPPGSLISCQNYAPSINGGYERIAGYERYDGHSRPSSATYSTVACTLTTTPAAGTVVTIGAATGRFVEAVTGGCLLTDVSGTIPGSTSMTIAGPTTIGTTAASSTLNLSITAAADAQYLVDSADVMRALISAPTGSGAIRGVCIYNGTVYCFRDNAGGTAGQMYKATTSGWQLQTFGSEVSFSNANTSVGEGDVLTQGGVSATIARVVVQTGTLASGTNTGRLIITGITGGNFAAGAASSTGGGALTLSGAQTAITLVAGGTYSFDVANFYGQLTTTRLYFTNGVNRAMEWDGTTLVPIASSASTDTPKFCKVHRNYLYLTVGSDLFNSSVGTPYRFVTAEGSAQTAVGDTITGLASLPGEALGILCRNSSFALTGASSSSWSLNVIRSDVGAVAYTVATMSDTYMLDDRGIISISTTKNYGNFIDATLSRVVQPLIDSIRTKVVGAYVSRQKAHYIIVCTDGSCVVMGVANGQVTGFTTLLLGFTPSCVWSGEDGDGVERFYAGSSAGQVYELNVGSTFDGDAIEAYARIYYTSSRSPRMRKRYRKMILEMTNTLYSVFSFSADYSFGAKEISQTASDNFSAYGGGGFWNVSNWDQFYWDASEISEPTATLDGTGLNVALTFYSNTKLDHGHTLQGAQLHYTPRHIER